MKSIEIQIGEITLRVGANSAGCGNIIVQVGGDGRALPGIVYWRDNGKCYRGEYDRMHRLPIRETELPVARKQYECLKRLRMSVMSKIQITSQGAKSAAAHINYAVKAINGPDVSMLCARYSELVASFKSFRWDLVGVSIHEGKPFIWVMGFWSNEPDGAIMGFSDKTLSKAEAIPKSKRHLKDVLLGY